jgi:hypothetical protein
VRLETILKPYQTIQMNMNSRESCHPSHLTDKEGAMLEPLMPEPSWFKDRPRKHSWQEILNGIFYITRSDCP